MTTDANALWNIFVSVILPLFSICAFAYMLYMNRRVAPLLKFAERIFKQWGSLMNEKREDKHHFQKLTEDQKRSRSKLVKEIKARVPFKLLDNHSENEVIAFIQDQELMKGFIFLGQTGQKFLEKIVGVISPKQRKKHGLDEIPTIQ